MNKRRLLGSLILYFWLPFLVLGTLLLIYNQRTLSSLEKTERAKLFQEVRLVLAHNAFEPNQVRSFLADRDISDYILFRENEKQNIVVMHSSFSRRGTEAWKSLLAGPTTDPQIVRIENQRGKDLFYTWQKYSKDRPYGFALDWSTRAELYKSQSRNFFFILLFASTLFLLITFVWMFRQARALDRVGNFIRNLLRQEAEAKLPQLPNHYGRLREELRMAGEAFTAFRESNEIARQNLRGILSSMGEAVFAVNDENNLVFYNDASIDMFDLRNPPEGLVSFQDAVRVPKLHELLDKVRTRKHSAREVVHFFLPKGEFTVDAYATPMMHENSSGVLIVLHDLTTLQKADQIRSDFVANASHELRTPITSIKGFSDALQSSPEPDAQTRKRFLKRISDQTAHLTNLIQDLLNLARIERQEDSRPKQSLNLYSLLTDAIERFEPSANSQNIELQLEQNDPDLIIRSNRDAFDQVLDNLVDNALKYTPEGGKITIKSKKDSSDAILDIIDTGIGIEPKELERIFERFYRTQKARNISPNGTGLGLAIVKHLVEGQGGTIWVESPNAGGTRVSLRWPLSSQNEPVF